MTSFVRPLIAEIIQRFRAFYRQSFCQRTVNQNEAGKEEIYKINLLEAMFMVKDV
jgi:hypothetical protein